ncbi:hypothetical protein N7471_008691 [Penicillium samsonianum]|uniref:uncharacterized protein n=1 Tax=Penicillium samsonianum TaxID=1882272 RepID=UPI002549BDA5|nr:uncharacterized protein N7471_008691 [Penicillium samsonianum]KAJ6133476.1 hypothetical protein N7471_008691 [Penicillium samsonianum]
MIADADMPAQNELRATEITPLIAEGFQDRQSKIVPRKRLLVIFPALALVHFTSFIDQTSVSTTLPSIAAALNAGSSISWIGTSFLTASTSIQLINGRLSDIFGRKTCLITALLLMGLGNFLSGCSQTTGQLYATRAFSGLGAGALNALVQITISDITRLDQRGYYFGILGVAVALGNGLGPVVGGLLTEKASWRWAFWFICPLAVIAAGLLALVLPGSSAADDIGTKVRMLDWGGIGISMTAVILILIPISQGGSVIEWTSPIIIGMLVSGVILLGAFIFIEWRLVKLPILPMRLFQYNRSTNILLAMNIPIGWVYWGNLFYLPLYFQTVRRLNPSTAGSFILPMVIAHGATSGLSGVVMSLAGCYKPIISSGAALWAIGAIVKSTYGQTTPFSLFFVAGIFEGIGVGCALQPVMVGLLAGSDNVDRAVITGLRNFIRDMGGTIGITVSGAILNNYLHAGLKGHFSPEMISHIASSAFNLSETNLSAEEKSMILDVYVGGINAVFVSYGVLTVVLFLATLCLRDYGLDRKPEQQESDAE